MQNKLLSIDKYFIYLVIAGLPLYYFFRQESDTVSLVYSALLVILFSISFIKSFPKYFTNVKLNKIDLFLEFLIICNIFFAIVILDLWDNNLILLFVFLFIAKYITSSSNDYFEVGANALTLSALIASIGVAAGYFEEIFLESHIFNQVMDFDYPYSDGLNKTILLNGFFPSANGSAYCICAGLAFTHYQNLIKEGKFKNILYFFLGLALLLTKAKIAVLFSFSILGIYFLKNQRSLMIIYFFLLIISYIFLSHIIVAINGTYDYPSIHFREILFSIGSVDFILGNYGMYKIYSIDAMSSNFFFPIGISEFDKVYSGRPHFMFGYLMIAGGVSMAILIALYLIFYLSHNFKKARDLIENNFLYLGAIICFIVETVNWSFANNIFFWMTIMGLNSNYLIRTNKNIS